MINELENAINCLKFGSIRLTLNTNHDNSLKYDCNRHHNQDVALTVEIFLAVLHPGVNVYIPKNTSKNVKKFGVFIKTC